MFDIRNFKNLRQLEKEIREDLRKTNCLNYCDADDIIRGKNHSIRINKWLSALQYLVQNPIFGWGAAAFPILYFSKSGEWFGHAHNLPLELAISYGILPSLILFSFYLSLLYLSFKKISKFPPQSSNNICFFLNEKAWFASSLIFFLSHLVDIQYFDARISILCWILLAGIRSFLKEELPKESLIVN